MLWNKWVWNPGLGVRLPLCLIPTGISLIMWNALYTAEKVIIRWTLLTEACYFGVQSLGEWHRVGRLSGCRRRRPEHWALLQHRPAS